ncbi:MAG: BTAD domain-containing putative transcriptional regulator [Acidobacteriota bacterium]
MRSTLEIHLLGRFRVAVDGIELERSGWPRRQAKSLLKLLALSPGHQLHREQVMEALWPETAPRAAGNNLHKIIHMARRSLEPELRSGASSRFVLRHSGQILLRAPGGVWVDAEVFERCANEAFRGTDTRGYLNALALYEGDLLSEDLYEEWCWPQRENLRGLYQRLLSKLARIHESEGQLQSSIECLNQLVASEPSNEAAHRRLMRLYAATGQRQKALRQFLLCRKAVRSDLDVEVEDATSQLHRQILSGQIPPLPASRLGGLSGLEKAVDSLAVLPFANQTGEPDLEYLCEGVTESLINSLAQLPQLRVMARTSVFRYKGTTADPRTIGRELGVRAVLVGRVCHRGEKLIIGIELVDVADGAQLWAEQYHRRPADILKVQEEISKEVLEKLELKLTGPQRMQLKKRHTADAKAYRFYLKGRFYWNKRTGEGLQKGIHYFLKASAQDPGYALARVGLADCYNLLSLYSLTLSTEAMPKAKASASRALSIDDSLAEAHTSLAYSRLYYDWDWERAERGFQRALELNPNYPTAHHWYHEFLTAMGRFEEAIGEITRAAELDPLSLIINTDVGWGLYYSRQYGQAIRQLRKTLEMDSNFAVAHLILGMIYLEKRMLERGVVEIRTALSLSGVNPFPLAVGMLGCAYGLSGERRKAAATLNRLRDLSGQGYVPAYCMALVANGLGETEQALRWLRRACDERYDRLIYLSVEPLFDNLHSEPGFLDLLRRIGLPAQKSDVTPSRQFEIPNLQA